MMEVVEQNEMWKDVGADMKYSHTTYSGKGMNIFTHAPVADIILSKPYLHMISKCILFRLWTFGLLFQTTSQRSVTSLLLREMFFSNRLC